MLEISQADVEARLKTDNPWWNGPDSLDRYYLDMPRRDYFDGFYELVAQRDPRRAVILMGPRRVGKTVMIHQSVGRLIENGVPPERILYASVDTPMYSGMALESLLRLFLGLHGLSPDSVAFVFFDEVQYLKDWEVHLKNLVDTYRGIKFVASGSAAAALKLKSHESGAGRFTDFTLPPLTFAEYLRFKGREGELIQGFKGPRAIIDPQVTDINALNTEFVNYINYGGYPEAVMSADVRENPTRFIKRDIVDKVLLRDLPSLYGIQDIQELNKLFTTIAYNTGNEISLEGLSQSSGVGKNTLKKYLEYLEAAFLVVKVKRLDENGRDFQRDRFFKVYLTNPSLRAALFQPVEETDTRLMGNLAETAIFSQWFHSDEMQRIRYARWKKGEVDLVYVHQFKPQWAVEVKWSDRAVHNPKEMAPLVAFASRHKLGTQDADIEIRVTITTKSLLEIKKIDGVRVFFRPSSLYCYLVGKVVVG